jgi:PAS domain-containing protein
MGGAVSNLSDKLETVDPILMEFFGDTVIRGSELFMKDEYARKEFIKYFNNGSWKEKLVPHRALFEDIIKALPLSTYSDFVFSSSPSEFCQQQILASTVNNTGSQKFDQSYKLALEDVRKKMKYILLNAVFPLFLRSPDYDEFLRAREKETDLLLFVDDSKRPNYLTDANLNESSDTRIDRLIDLFSENPQATTSALMSVVNDASQSIDEEEMHFMLQHSYGLANVFAAVENLRYCVSLATARSDRPGFPLVYVNKAFEAATGYKREEIIGRNCSFLQSESTEKDQIDLMIRALAAAQPVKVAITNRHKDGTGCRYLMC